MIHRTVPTLAVLAVLLGSAALAGADFPKPSGPINDFANVLDAATEQELLALVRAVEDETTAEIAVATVPSLNGISVEEYANKLFADWGIGQKGKDNGVLVLVAPSERKIRVEVGYGLEPVLPDGLTGSIIRDQFVPALRNSDYPTGVLDGVRRIAAIVRRGQVLTESERQALQTQAGPPVIVLPAWVMLPFWALLIAGGSYMLGIGSSAQVVAMVVVGAVVAGAGLLFSYFVALWGLVLQVPLAVWALRRGIKKGASPGYRASLRGPTSRTGWVAGASRSSSSRSSSSSSRSSSSSFGGGRSGGGGASGSW
jgi:uncharacterized protein